MKITSILPVLACAIPMAAQDQGVRKSHIDDLLTGARAKAAQTPPRSEAYNDLADALIRRAREKSDPAYLGKAEDAVNQSLRIAPANFEARKARVMIRLQQRRFADALEEAQALNRTLPDDNLMYGLICDAQLGLGNYKEAEASAQRMIDLRQVSAPGLQRGAAIREAIGYTDGALEWWGSALRLTSATDEEERAYILTQLARVNRQNGKPDAAGRYAEEALTLVPSYPQGLTELALDRMDGEKPAQAVELLKQRLAISKEIESLYWLAEALGAAGAQPESASAFADFEKEAVALSGEPVNANPLLIVYEADHGKPAVALRIAKESVGRRHDSETLDAYAWALYCSGDYAEARKQEELALAPGIRNARFYFHAGMVARKNNDVAAAGRFFRKSLEINSGSAEASQAIQELATLPKSSL